MEYYYNLVTLLTTVVGILYTVWAIIEEKSDTGVLRLPRSYSISYYDFRPRYRWVFQVFIWTTSFCIMFSSGAIVSPDYIWFPLGKVLYLISGLFLAGVGFTPTVLNPKMRPWHIGTAVIGIAAGYVATIVYVEHGLVWVALAALVVGISTLIEQSIYNLIAKVELVSLLLLFISITWGVYY